MAEVETNKVLSVLKTYMKSLMNNRFLLICCTPDQFYHFIQDINNEIESKSFSVIKTQDSDIITLKTISQVLRIIQSHIRSDYDGIVSELDSKYSSWKNCKEKYQGISKEVAISPHTDGTFLEGMFPAKTTMKVLESILAKRPKLAEILMKPVCVAFCRDDHMSMNYPVYEHMQDDSIRIHFRYDQTTFAPYWSYEA
ncbi:30360_t:CDS:2, partial [Gigaspora margarita]